MPVKLLTEKAAHIPPLSVLLERLAPYGESFVLGDFSADGPGRYSYLSLSPREVLIFNPGYPGDPLALFDEALQRYQLSEDTTLPVPFVGGWVGYLSYDLGRYIECLTDNVTHDIGLPLLRFGFYDSLLAWDQQERNGYILALEYPEQKSSPSDRLDQLRLLCQDSAKSQLATIQTVTPSKKIPATIELVKKMRANIKHHDYLDKVTQAREYILAGDIFEVNLSQRFSCPYRTQPEKLYYYLTEHNPAGYAALLRGSDHAVVSASPELFLSKRNNQIITRPIKGTAPRGKTSRQDQARRDQLLHSGKDKAELNMIIDLERNDLGRVCRYGSVEVLQERIIETHPTVFHAVATIAGQLRRNVSIADILRATFPGGSITGAPKIRAMEIIDELEPTARDVYTGSIGWIGLNGDMELNLAIRTVILIGQEAHVQVGGAVVTESDPQKEYDETLDKAAALVRALYVTNKTNIVKVEQNV